MTIAPSAAAPAADSLLASLDPEQRAAAMLPDGPAQVIAPAGSGKTTTLIARLGVLLDRGVAADRIGVVTFNRDAAAELSARITSRLAPHVPGAEAVEVRTLHALARQVLLDAGRPVRLLPDRLPLLRAARRRALAELRIAPDRDDPPPEPPDLAALDLIVSAWKIDGRTPPPEAAATVDAFAALLALRGQIDFDDLVVGAVAALEGDPRLRRRWQARFSHLCVDEFQDVDAAQLRLVRLLAAPEDNLFVVGDDDQTIYGWRLADVRRLLGLADEALPGLMRVDLETNYRCPTTVLERAVRLVEHNVERFAKVIRPGPEAKGVVVLAPSAADDVDRAAAVLASWPPDGGTRAVLARTNRELLPVVAAALRLGMPFRAAELTLPIESPIVHELLTTARRANPAGHPLIALGLLEERSRRAMDGGDADDADDAVAAALVERRAVAAALLGWAASCRSLDDLADAVRTTRERLNELRRDDAPLLLATAHGTKGLEFDHVAVVGMDDGRFPSARSVAEAVEPERALEEERRLAYVAWTRARRSLTLVYDPGAPSQFLREAFDSTELGLRTA